MSDKNRTKATQNIFRGAELTRVSKTQRMLNWRPQTPPDTTPGTTFCWHWILQMFMLIWPWWQKKSLKQWTHPSYKRLQNYLNCEPGWSLSGCNWRQSQEKQIKFCRWTWCPLYLFKGQSSGLCGSLSSPLLTPHHTTSARPPQHSTFREDTKDFRWVGTERSLRFTCSPIGMLLSNNICEDRSSCKGSKARPKCPWNKQKTM